MLNPLPPEHTTDDAYIVIVWMFLVRTDSGDRLIYNLYSWNYYGIQDDFYDSG